MQLFVGNFVFVYLDGGRLDPARALRPRPRTRCSRPIYWGLMSIAAWKGFYQLFTKPFYWEKTEHGLDAGGEH